MPGFPSHTYSYPFGPVFSQYCFLMSDYLQKVSVYSLSFYIEKVIVLFVLV